MGGGKSFVVVVGGGIGRTSSWGICEKWHSATWYESYGFGQHAVVVLSSGRREGCYVSRAPAAVGPGFTGKEASRQTRRERVRVPWARAEGSDSGECAKEYRKKGGGRKVLVGVGLRGATRTGGSAASQWQTPPGRPCPLPLSYQYCRRASILASRRPMTNQRNACHYYFGDSDSAGSLTPVDFPIRRLHGALGNLAPILTTPHMAAPQRVSAQPSTHDLRLVRGWRLCGILVAVTSACDDVMAALCAFASPWCAVGCRMAKQQAAHPSSKSPATGLRAPGASGRGHTGHSPPSCAQVG